MKRALIVVAGLALMAACSSSTPKAFPGTPEQRVAEVIRRADALDVRHADADVLGPLLGTDAGTSCTYKSKDARNTSHEMGSALSPGVDWTLDDIIVAVYCPRLSN